MEITYQKTRENKDDITVWFTLTDDEGNSYEWHGDIPKEVDVQNYLDSQKEKYLELIRKREYPDMPVLQLEVEQWIAGGCWIDDETQAEKVEWTNKHPVELDGFDRCKPSNDTVIAFDSATTVEQLKAVLRKMLIKQGPE